MSFVDECLAAVGFKYVEEDADEVATKIEEKPQKLIEEITSDESRSSSDSSSSSAGGEDSDSD